MLLPVISFLCEQKGGIVGGGWVHLQGANNMAIFGLCCRRPWLAPGGPFLSIL